MALLLPISVKPSHKTLEHSQTHRNCPKSSKVNFTFEFDLWYLSNIIHIYIYISTYIIPHFLTFQRPNDTTGEALAQVPSTLVSSLQFDQTRRRQKPGILPPEIHLRAVRNLPRDAPCSIRPFSCRSTDGLGGHGSGTCYSVQHPGGLCFHLLSILFHIFFIFFNISFHIFPYFYVQSTGTWKNHRKNNYGTWTIIENHRTYSFFRLFQSIGTWKIIDLQFRSRVSAKKQQPRPKGLPQIVMKQPTPGYFFITNMQCPKLESHPPSAKPTLFIFFHFIFFGFPCLERPCLRSRSNSPGSGLHPKGHFSSSRNELIDFDR